MSEIMDIVEHDRLFERYANAKSKKERNEIGEILDMLLGPGWSYTIGEMKENGKK